MIYLQHYFFLSSHFTMAFCFLFPGPNQYTKSAITKKQVWIYGFV